MTRSSAGVCRRGGAALAVVAASLVVVLDQRPASATVTSVSGGAFGYYTNVGLFGGAQSVRGHGQTVPPGDAASASPSVTLPSAGGSGTATDPDGAVGAYGPAVIFESHGAMTVSTEGTTGATGSSTSSAEVKDIGPQDPFTAPAPGGVRSTCSASETGLSGSTTITGGRLLLQDPDPDVSNEPGEIVVTPPVNPAPGTRYTGVVANVNDYFSIVFNEQIFSADSITVNAVHMYLEGPTAVGDMIIAQSRCGVAASTANQAPVANDDAYSTGVGRSLTVPAPGLLRNDSDAEGGPLLVTRVPPTPPPTTGTTCQPYPARCAVWGSPSDPAHGSLTLNADGSFTYTPNAGFQGTDSFTYLAIDKRGRSDTAKVTITVTPATYLSVANVWVAEGSSGSTTATFTITRSGNTSGSSTVTYATSNGTATAGSDYTAVPATTVTFGAGETTKTVPVAVTGDLLPEAHETFNLVLSAAAGAVISDASGIATIQNDDGAAYLSVRDAWVREANVATTVTFTVTRSGNTSGPVSVSYATSNGTAVAGADYTAIPATALSFAAGETAKTVTVTVAGDTLPEAHETFNLVLSGAVGAAIIDTSGVGTIVNDDGAAYLSVGDVSVTEGNSGSTTATFTITRSGNTAGSSTVTYATGNGTALAGTDYTAVPATTVTFAPGQTSKAVSVAVIGDVTDEVNETFSLNLSGAVGAVVSDGSGVATVVDDEGAVTPGPSTFYSASDVSVFEGNSGSTAATFVVTRSGDVAAAGSVRYVTANVSAVAPGDYTPAASTVLGFAAGERTKSVTVNVVGDTVTEGDETFRLDLSAPVGGVISDPSATATIVNDEFSAFSVSDVQLTEANAGTTAATFTVTRSGNTAGPASVRYVTANGTAVAPGDYTALPLTTLSFATGETSKQVSVNVVGDTLLEGDETFNLNLSAPVGGAVADPTGVATVVNNDFAELSISDASKIEGQSGTSLVTFVVTRSGTTTGTASFTWATANGSAIAGSDYTAVAPTSVAFAPGETTKTLTVSVTGDTAVEPAETFAVNLTAPAGAVLGDAAALATIVNDD